MFNTFAVLAALALAAQTQPHPGSDEGNQADAAQQTEEAVQPNSSAASAEQDAQQEIAEEDRVICRRTTIVGSKFKRRLCATKKEWEKLRRNAKEATDDFHRKSSRSGAPTG